MISLTQRDGVLTLARDGQTFTLPASEAPQLIQAVLESFGITGTPHQRGYALGYGDGKLDGYTSRDREYVLMQDAEARARTRATRAALLAALERSTHAA